MEENTLAGAGFCHWRNVREILTIKAIASSGFSNSIEALGGKNKLGVKGKGSP